MHAQVEGLRISQIEGLKIYREEVYEEKVYGKGVYGEKVCGEGIYQKVYGEEEKSTRLQVQEWVNSLWVVALTIAIGAWCCL